MTFKKTLGLTILPCLAILFLMPPARAADSPAIIMVAAKPDTGKDSTMAIQDAIGAAAKVNGPVVIRFQPGQYDLFRTNAKRLAYYMSNTASERENPDPTKIVAVWVKGLQHVTIDGQGALLMLHGEMTGFVIDDCKDLTLSNLSYDMADPSVTEVKITEVTSNALTCETLPDTHYRLEGNKVVFYGDGWEFSNGPVQAYDPVRDVTWRCANLFKGATIDEIAPRQLRVAFSKPPAAKVGWHYQFRHGVRNEVGGFIYESHDVTLDHVTMHFMHGFGILGQTSENLTFNNFVCETRPETGRTCASSADILHLSGCRGLIKMTNSVFCGAQDDAINIHGVHLRVSERPAPDQILVRFMHPQTYGFDAYFAGDEINFIHPNTLMPFATNTVKIVERKSPREILLTLDHPVPPDIALNKDVIENVTWTPEVQIQGCSFSRIPTRGILVTTRRKVLIENNTFTRMGMSAVFIADDGKSWYESGMVREVTIQGNRFVECGEPVIGIHPEVMPGATDYVHSNISILDNVFTLTGHRAVDASFTDGLKCEGNTFITAEPAQPGNLIRDTNCSRVSITGNTVRQKNGSM